MSTMLARRAYATIDRSKPAAAMIAAAYTRNPKVALRVDFSDDVAGPFPASFLCFQTGGGPTGVCDTGAGADYGAATPDGPLWACA